MGFWFLHKQDINVVNSGYSPEFIIVKINFLLVNVEREKHKSLIKRQVALPQHSDCGVTFYYNYFLAIVLSLIKIDDVSFGKHFDHSLFFEWLDIKKLRILWVICME